MRHIGLPKQWLLFFAWLLPASCQVHKLGNKSEDPVRYLITTKFSDPSGQFENFAKQNIIGKRYIGNPVLENRGDASMISFTLLKPQNLSLTNLLSLYKESLSPESGNNLLIGSLDTSNSIDTILFMKDAKTIKAKMKKSNKLLWQVYYYSN